MKVLDSVRQRLATNRDDAHRCCVCDTRFEKRPLNCPACGTTAIEPV